MERQDFLSYTTSRLCLHHDNVVTVLVALVAGLGGPIGVVCGPLIRAVDVKKPKSTISILISNMKNISIRAAGFVVRSLYA